MGQRIAKHIGVYPGRSAGNNSSNWEKTTYYFIYAQGNVLSVYEHQVDAPTISFTQKEKHLYGSSRIGMDITTTELIAASAPDDTLMQHVVGNKHYELSNHLGNVLAVITDKKIPIEDGGNPGEVDYFEPELISSSDYSPFGTALYGRNWSSEKYRYGFQGQERDDEMKGEGNSVNFTYRMHDPRLGRFFAVDPINKKYPYLTPYQFSSNQPIHAKEFEGLENSNEFPVFPSASSAAYAEAQLFTSASKPIVKLVIGTPFIYVAKYLDSKVATYNETQKQEVFKSNANKTVAILLYEFATNSGPIHRTFKEGMPFTEAIKEAVARELTESFLEMNFKQKNYLSKLEKQENVMYNFSPDHTSSYLESAEKHVKANPATMFVGGLMGVVSPIYNDDGTLTLNFNLTNYTSNSSAFYRLVKDSEASFTGLNGIIQTIEFNITLTSVQINNIADSVSEKMQKDEEK